MAIQALRSLAFYVIFFVQTAVLAVLVGTIAILRRQWFGFGIAVAMYWARSNLFLLRWIVGIRTEVSGAENIPEGGCIIAAKHQSDWDIFAILPYSGRPAFIAKRELMAIPFFGWAALSLETISIDRKQGTQGLAGMLSAAKGAISRGCRIIIFPEGTRSKPLMPPVYKFGSAKLYEALNVPIVPAALNSGLFWRRNSLILWPGKAQLRFLPPIEPGLAAVDMQKKLMTIIEAESDKLILEAAAAGIASPLSPEMRKRLAELQGE